VRTSWKQETSAGKGCPSNKNNNINNNNNNNNNNTVGGSLMDSHTPI
jgi:hypothetical protein